MKKIVICLIIILSIKTIAKAQNNNPPPKVDTGKNMEDVVYLKNGAIVRGIIIEQIPNKSLDIKSDDNNYFVFKFDEIQKITKENRVSDLTDYKKKGFLNITELGFGFGVNTINTYRGSFDISHAYPISGIRTINGYQMNEYFSFGLGVGFESIIDGTNKGALMPLTADVRMNLRKGKITPTLTLNGGYAVGFQTSSGLTANPTVGVRIYITKKIAFLFNMGYEVLQQNVQEPDQYGVLVPRILNYQYFSMNAGLSF
jgi:hypothetical protein